MEKTNTHLFYSYNIIISLLEHFSLIIKYGKTEVFHFSRSQGLFDPPLLDLSSIGVGNLILHPKNSWKYLRYISLIENSLFANILDFIPKKCHLWLSAWKCLEIWPQNSFPIRNASSIKHVFFLLPFTAFCYNTTIKCHYLLKELNKMQQRAVLWITGAFCTSPTLSIEAIAGLISIYLHLQNWVVNTNYKCLYSPIIILSNCFLRKDMLHSLNFIVSPWKT